jgi:Domain of unknown function (DUF4136)
MRGVNMKQFLGIASALVGLAGLASAQDVKTNFDPTVNFSKFTTYRWVDVKGSPSADSITDRQIKADIDADLARKGFTRTDSETASMYVAYQIATQAQQQLNWYNMGGGWGWGGGMGSATTSTVEVGSLAIDFYDPSTKLMIWRGVGTKSLDPSSNPEKNQERLTKAVNKILKDFPPKHK